MDAWSGQLLQTLAGGSKTFPRRSYYYSYMGDQIMTQVLIEVDIKDLNLLKTELSSALEHVQFIESKRLDGILILQIFAALNTVTIPLLGKIIIERIRANKNVVVKAKGVTISGLNADDVVKVLTQLSGND